MELLALNENTFTPILLEDCIVKLDTDNTEYDATDDFWFCIDSSDGELVFYKKDLNGVDEETKKSYKEYNALRVKSVETNAETEDIIVTVEPVRVEKDSDKYYIWDSTVPTAKETGNYTVYYKFIGDVVHNDSDPMLLNVTISKPSSGGYVQPHYKQNYEVILESYDYDETAHEPQVKGVHIGTRTDTYKNKDTGEVLTEAPTAPGTYVLTVAYSGNSFFDPCEKSVEYTITGEETEITKQPQVSSGKVGETAKFTVQATGTNLSYQWQFFDTVRWVNSGMTGNQTANLSVPITAARNGQKYRCIVKGADGKTVTSDAAAIETK